MGLRDASASKNVFVQKRRKKKPLWKLAGIVWLPAAPVHCLLLQPPGTHNQPTHLALVKPAEFLVVVVFWLLFVFIVQYLLLPHLAHQTISTQPTSQQPANQQTKKTTNPICLFFFRCFALSCFCCYAWSELGKHAKQIFGKSWDFGPRGGGGGSDPIPTFFQNWPKPYLPWNCP